MSKASKTILFVEDNPLVLGVYRNWLQREGFRVESADDGMAALEKLVKVKPDLLILDLMLPRLNGLEVLKCIREHSDFKGIPVMILSNVYLDEPASKVMIAGANKRMLKSECSPKKLIEAVRELLGMAPVQNGRQQNDAALAETNEALLKEARKNLLADASKEIACIREHCLAFVKTSGTPAGVEHLNNLYEQVRLLCTRIGLGDCPKMAHLVSALEAMLFEIICRKSLPSPSVLQTLAQGVDCLERLFKHGDICSADGLLKAKVLIVDDDPVCNYATVSAMKRAKLKAISTERPAHALELAEAECYSIVLLDIHMPGLNGFELCEKIRLLPQYKTTPVIFITSNSEFQNRAQAILSGGDDLIAKPIFPLELVLKTIMQIIKSSEERARKPSPGTIPFSLAVPPASSVAEQIELHAEQVLSAQENEDAVAYPIAPAVSDNLLIKPKDGKPVASEMETDLDRTARHLPPPAVEFPVSRPISPEPLPVNRINPPSNGANHKIPMNIQQENRTFDAITHEVTRIIFGDDKLSEMHLRLTRIALERYNVPEITNRKLDSKARGNGVMPDGIKDDPSHQIAREVARIIFGDDNVSEMHLRLTSIALERYHIPEIVQRLPETHIPEIVQRLPETNGKNGSPAEPALSMRL